MRRLTSAALLVSGLIIAAGCGGGGQEVAPMSADSSPKPSEARVQLVLRTGTYFGECFVDCEEEILLSAETTVYKLTSRFPDADHPDIEEHRTTDPTAWEELIALADPDALRRLPERFGEPDAADQGGEWIEITIGAESRRVDFELGAPVSELEPLLSELRRLRGELSRTYRSLHRPRP